jgi:hypothetical protein
MSKSLNQTDVMEHLEIGGVLTAYDDQGFHSAAIEGTSYRYSIPKRVLYAMLKNGKIYEAFRTQMDVVYFNAADKQ